MCDSNKNEIIDLVGYTGGFMLSVCLIPQIYKIIKTKEVKNISYLWQFMYIIGSILHLYYGAYYNLLPIYIPAIIELSLILLLLSLKIRYKKTEEIN